MDYEKKYKEALETSDFKTKLAEYLQNNSPKDGQYVISSESILEMAKEELIKRGELKEQKPAWSDEDEKMRDRIIDILNRTFSVYSALGTSSTRPSCPTYKDEVNWLKSLRPTKDCNGCPKHLEGYISGRSDAENKLLEMYGILLMPDGELRMKPQWKPNKEQLDALEECGECKRCIKKLYEQLKKL